MPLDSYENIFEQFPAISAEEWKQKIIHDLKGEPIEKLTGHIDGIDVLPFYTKEDTAKYSLNIPPKSNTGWQIAERIKVDSITDANREALDALQMGANAIVFDLQHKNYSEGDITSLQKDILTEAASIYFENGRGEKIIVPKSDSSADELVYALKNSSSNNFHFFIGENYFFEIAKLRAFRWLMKQVCELEDRPYNIFVFAETVVHSEEADENKNMLRNTTAAMSAILGGCDALIINSHDASKENSGFGKRIARNIQHILQFESYFTEIDDAAKGSYYIEYLTHELSKKVWDIISKS